MYHCILVCNEIGLWTHKRQPICRPYWRCREKLWSFGRNWSHQTASHGIQRLGKGVSEMAWNTCIDYSDVIMNAMTFRPLDGLFKRCSDADQRKHQSSASLAFVWGIHRGPVNSPHKWPVTRKMFPFDDVIMCFTIVLVQEKKKQFIAWICTI